MPLRRRPLFWGNPKRWIQISLLVFAKSKKNKNNYLYCIVPILCVNTHGTGVLRLCLWGCNTESKEKPILRGTNREVMCRFAVIATLMRKPPVFSEGARPYPVTAPLPLAEANVKTDAEQQRHPPSLIHFQPFYWISWNPQIRRCKGRLLNLSTRHESPSSWVAH